MRLDYAPGAILYFKFATVRPSTGAPFALSGGAISVYKDNSTTQSTNGVTLTADFDSVTGLNHVTIDTSADGTFYSSGSSFQLVITAGTVDSVSVVGQVVGEFSLNRTSAIRPTTAGRTLAVAATGAVTMGTDSFGTTLVVGNIASSSDVTAIKAKTDNLPADPADASDIAAAFSTVNSTLATIAAYIDTEIAAIKAKTDGLPADTAATLTTIQALVDTVETELAKVIKSGESRTIARTGKTSVTFTETRA